MLPRSRSAPKPLSDFAPLATAPTASRPKLSRSHTVATLATNPHTSPRESREDPFNLIGFFPSCPAESHEDWDWLHSSEIPEIEDEEVTREYADFLLSENHNVKKGSSYDEFAREVIDGEDKFGTLAFSYENFPTLIRSKMPTFEGPMSPVHVSPLAVDEPLDLDALHKRLCLRRETLGTGEAGEGPMLGQLFFFSGEEEKEDGDWTAGLYGRLASLWTRPRWLDVIKGFALYDSADMVKG